MYVCYDDSNTFDLHTILVYLFLLIFILKWMALLF